jgi:VWFA-related protein
VPVTVIGRDGNPVRGLTAANFELYDNGRRTPIASFDTIDFKSPDYQSPNAAMNPAARRNFMLLFDLSFSSVQSLRRAQKAAGDFLAQSLQKRDRAAVATLDIRKGFRLLTAFTTDRAVLTAAIRDPLNFTGSDPLQIAAVTPAPVPMEPGLPANSNVPAVRSDALAQAADAQREIGRRAAAFDDQFMRQQIDRQINMLASLTRSMQGVYGRKELVLLSEGFDPKLVQGRTKLMVADAADEQQMVEKGEIWKVDNDRRFGNIASLSLVERLGTICKRADVVLHAIDIRGVRVDNDTETGVSSSSNDGLHLLANASGGTVFKNSNDLVTSMNRMLHEQEVVYILAFHAPSSDPGRFHTLKVKLSGVTNAKKVEHRTGYYERGGEGEAERTLATAEIILNDVPQPDVHIDTVAPVFPGTDGKASVPVIVDISGADILRWKDDAFVMADVYVYSFDGNGDVRDALHQRIMLDTDKVGGRLRAGGLKYYGTLSLPPGNFALRTFVRLPEVGRNGFARTDIAVPQKGVVTLTPPLFFDDPDRWVLVKGASHDESEGYPFSVGSSQQTSSVRVAP